jgi:hypothetical protein
VRFFTPEGGELIEIMTVKPERGGILIQGKIMGAMPMKAVLKPEQLRQGFRFLTPRLVLTLITMLFTRSNG